jgi:hypothetical protein
VPQYDSYGNLIPEAPVVTPSAPTTPPTQYNFNALAPGYTPDSWAKLIQGNSDYMGFTLSAAEQQDIAAANRKAALRTLAVRYGGIPEGFQDTYGDLDANTLKTARDNPYSNYAQLARQYSEDVFSRRQGLGARGMTQSGELPFELGQADYSHGAGLYENANQFGEQVSGAMKDYAGTLNNLRQQQIDAIRRAAQAVYDQGYRLGGAGGAGGAAEPDVYMGVPGGRPAGNGEQKYVTSQSQLDTSGGWGVIWQGPGTYTAVKSAPDASGHSDTNWIFVPAEAPAAAVPAPTPAPVAAPTPLPSAPTSTAVQQARILLRRE